MECMNKCGVELTGKQKIYCSDKCRKQHGRNSDKSQVGQPINPDKHKVGHKSDILNYGQPNCCCQHCQTNRANNNKHIINHGAYKRSHELGENELNRVALPGDVDFEGVCSGSGSGSGDG